jgi:solute carrier family 25 phosphate transporter 23/24/25/41
MGTYETLKTAYCRSTGKDEPEVYAVLSFGALSGSIGAASVYRELSYLLTALRLAPFPFLASLHLPLFAQHSLALNHPSDCTLTPAINLLRTRLQASGSSGHPQAYKGFTDVLQQTIQKEGYRGLYKGLLPSILKVGPAVGVSWIVYEDMKRRLGV